MRELVRNAVEDITAGVRMRNVWMALASEDIGDAHRRTLLGPIWLLINYLLFAGTFMMIFRGRFDVDNYPAYVAVGLLVWLFISETISQSIGLFAREESFIKGTTLPLSVYVMRQCMQSLIRAGYALIGAAGILLATGTTPSLPWIWSVLAVLFILVTAPAVAIVFAVAGAIFPDLQFIISNVMRLGLFLTPIFWWHEGMGGVRASLYHFNPFTHYLTIVRAPILTGEIPVTSWELCLVMSALLWLAAIPLLGRFRKQIVFLL